MDEYLPILVLLALAVVFGVLSALVSKLLAPRLETEAKAAPYECGIVPRKDPPERFPVRFYLIAMIFIIFDIEIIFLYPWAVRFDALGAFGLAEMLVFTLAVVVSLCYLISNGALNWGPRRHMRDPEAIAEETIRRTTRPAQRPAGNAPLTEAAN